MEENEAAEGNGDSFDFISYLSGTGRDFLVRNTGEKVKIETLEGKKLGLYFSGSWCGPCQQFTPYLIEVYNELSSKGDFEIILVSADTYAEAFDRYFAKMPWLAIPFSDSERLKNLQEMFMVKGVPHLVILDGKGKVLTDQGVEIILHFGAEGYPFTPERIKEMEEQKEEAKKNQSLKYILVTPSRDFVISNDEKKVPVSELEGKMVGLYFFVPSHGRCSKFTPKLVEVYNKMKEMGESFEIVIICVDDNDDQLFRESLRSTPWFALPFTDNTWQKLVCYFELQSVPSLVIIGSDGKTLISNAVEAIEDYGIQAYPFTPEKFAELAELEKAEVVEKEGWPQKIKHALHSEHELVLTRRRSFLCDQCLEEGHRWSFYCEECDFDLHPKCALKEDTQEEKEYEEEMEEQSEEEMEEQGEAAIQEHTYQKKKEATQEQSLRSILVSPSRDFVLSNDGKKVPVSELEGKMVGLYFFVPFLESCRDFNPKLVEVYNKLKEMGERFEIVMVYLDDDDEESFKESFCTMPWFALPFDDDSCMELVQQFELESVPALVIIGPDGKMLHSNVAEAIEELGVQAYPFTSAKLEEVEKAKNAAQTLESILVSGNCDFVIAKDGAKVPVSNLVGKNILLYFSAQWCPACNIFLPLFIEAYQVIKAKDNLFEVIFISDDHSQESFNKFFSEMPWLALPFGDKRGVSLKRKFKVFGIPKVVAIGRTGKTVTTKAAPLIWDLGADAYSLIFQHENKVEEELKKSVKKDEKELETKVNENEKEIKKIVGKDDEELERMLIEDEELEETAPEYERELEETKNEDEEELEKTVKNDEEKPVTANKDEEIEGTMLNKLLRKLLSLIQRLVALFKKLGFLS